MWLPLGVAYVGSLSAVDFVVFNYLGLDTGISDVLFGVVGAAWSAVYILSNELLGRLADRGCYRALAVLSAASIAAALALIAASRGSSAPLIAAGYMAHAVAVASANLSLSAGIFELQPASEWDSSTSLQRLGLHAVRGAALLAVSLALGALGSYVLGAVAGLALALGLSYAASLPLPWLLGLERRLARALSRLSAVSAYSAGVGAFVYGRYDLAVRIAGAVSRGRGRPSAVALSASLSTFVGDYMLTALPLVFRGLDLSLSQYSMAFGLASLAAAAALAVLEGSTFGRPALAAILLARGLWMALALPLADSLAGLAAYVSVGLLIYSLADLMLYRLYYSLSEGYGVHRYMVMRELGSMLGSLAAGAAVQAGGELFLALPVAAAAASSALLTLA